MLRTRNYLAVAMGQLIYLIPLLCLVHLARPQTNIGNNVAEALLDCYNNSAIPGITTANQRLPSTINLLVEYLRKLEDANPTMSTQQLSLQILQRLRQDGIARTERVVDERLGVPYSSSRLERNKFRVLLTQLLPNVEQTLSNGDLTPVERCSLHYMISNTIDDLRRENEATECSRSARYTSRIHNRRRRRNDGEDRENTELVYQESGLGVSSANLAANVSQCPIELGVVYSPYGTIKAGNVLAGIAAGLNRQNVQDGVVDNAYAATIIGELCEASLYQARADVALGASGAWNSTINPKYFFLQNNNNLQATDAELRGALDGLYLALRMSTLTSTFADIKISQIIDMYYSSYERGVFDSSFKACNRNILYTEMTTSDTMRSQLLGFMPVLNIAAISGLSLRNNSFEIFTNSGINAFQNYLPQLASSDLACLGTSTVERVKTDLLIFLDSGWQYSTIESVIFYILSSVDVNKFQSRYTIYGGSSVRNLTSLGTPYLTDFFTQYNQTVHANETAGFDYVRIFETVEQYGYQKLNNNSYVGGESTIVLLVPRTGITDEQRPILSQRREIFQSLLPDVNFLVLGSGAASDYSAIVSNTDRDVVILQESTREDDLKDVGQKVVNSIKEVPRAVVNPGCTAQYSGSASTFTVTDYVEPLGVNYYRISPNYFFAGGDQRRLKFVEQGYGTIQVCTSRDNIQRDNSSSTCSNLANSEYSFDINGYCQGAISACSSIYISVRGVATNNRCTSVFCRFPDEVQFGITLENVACTRGAAKAVRASALLMILLAVLLRVSLL